MPKSPRSLAAVALAIVLVAGACGSSSKSAGQATTTTTTPASAGHTTGLAGKATKTAPANVSGEAFAKLTPTEILAAAAAAGSAATWVHLVGDLQGPGQSLKIDAHMGHEQGQGSVGNGSRQIQFVRDGADLYVTGDGTFLKAIAPQAYPLLTGKWIQTTADDRNFLYEVQFTDLKQFFTGLAKNSKDAKVTGTTTVQGIKVVQVTNKTSVISVALDAPHYLIQVTGVKGQPGSVTLTDWNVPFTLQVPPASQVVPIKAVAGTSTQS